MEYIVCIIILIFAIILIKFVFKSSIKKIKELKENPELSKITDNFPSNIDITKEYLEMLNNKDVKIEEIDNTKTSLYIGVTNKIILGDLKNNYGRLLLIAHECIHSIQDKALILFHFIISNILLIYFAMISLLTIFKVVQSFMFHIFILTFISLLHFAVRSYLETDAMIRSEFLAKEYIKKKSLLTEEEENKLLEEYKKINAVGITFVVSHLLSSCILKIIIYIAIVIAIT
jgi:hypothetical protein